MAILHIIAISYIIRLRGKKWNIVLQYWCTSTLVNLSSRVNRRRCTYPYEQIRQRWAIYLWGIRYSRYRLDIFSSVVKTTLYIFLIYLRTMSENFEKISWIVIKCTYLCYKHKDNILVILSFSIKNNKFNI